MAEKVAIEKNHMEEVVFLLAGLVILGVIATRLLYYLDNLGGGEYLWQNFLDKLLPYWRIWKIIVVILCSAAVVWAIYSYRKLAQVAEEEKKVYPPISGQSAMEELVMDAPKEKENERWVRVQKLANSENSSDWRLAILDADNMLDDVLRTAGYVGDGVGEMLKTIDKSDMLTLDNAWDAHKVRNRIAHDAGDFDLTERETRRVIALFEAVFKEMQII